MTKKVKITSKDWTKVSSIKPKSTGITEVKGNPRLTRQPQNMLQAASYNKNSYKNGSVGDALQGFTAAILTNIPYSDSDYRYFEDAWAHTLAGSAIDTEIDFVVGKGFRPTLEFINLQPYQDLPDEEKEDKINTDLQQYQYVIDKLEEMDRDLKVIQFIKDATVMAMVFGRAVLAFDGYNEGDKGIPKSLKIIHPRDLGRVEVNEIDWTLKWVYNLMGLQIEGDNRIMAEDMIYFVNKPNNPMRRNLLYGHSELERIIGSARALRRILEYDGPEIVEGMWAGYGLFTVDPDGKQPSDAKNELNTILNNLSPGTFGAVSKPLDKIKFEKFELNPNIDGLMKLVDTYERMIIGNSRIPAALLGREEDSNMATLFGKIRLFLAGPIAQRREWLGSIVDNQWYNMILSRMFPKESKMIRVKTEFEPIITESWVDNVDALQKLSVTIPNLPPSVYLELAGLEHYKNMLISDDEEGHQPKEDQTPSLDSGNDNIKQVQPDNIDNQIKQAKLGMLKEARKKLESIR